MTKPVPGPWLPVSYDKPVVMALKALQAGNASEGQQQLALRFIIERLCGTYDLPYRPGGPEGDRDTAFACGMQHVGKQIVKLLNLSAGLLDNPVRTNERRSRHR